MKQLKVSENRRFLVREDGTPFFWLADTAWELFHRCTLEEAERYFRNRQAKGFNVVQAVALAEFDGLRVPNAEGELPLHHEDPLQPNERYFSWIERFLDMAAAHGLWIALLPTWGDKLELLAHGKGPVIFNPVNARAYGAWIARRFRHKENLVWVNGGDRSGGGANYAVWQALAEGIQSEDTGHLMTFHPLGGGGGHSSSEWFHAAPWLDFNLAQSGHECRDLPNYDIITADYQRTPVRPCLDGEPRYEDHAVNWKPTELGYFDDYDARQAAYWAVFAGACGHTYGAHPIWQFLAPGRQPIGFARRPWTEALDLPGAAQVGYLKRLIESRPMLSRVPAQELLLDPGTGEQHVRATRGDGYLFVYLPVGGEVGMRLDLIEGGRGWRAWWFDPRLGRVTTATRPERVHANPLNPAERVTYFQAPTQGRGQDWVLVLEDSARNFNSPPGG